MSENDARRSTVHRSIELQTNAVFQTPQRDAGFRRVCEPAIDHVEADLNTFGNVATGLSCPDSLVAEIRPATRTSDGRALAQEPLCVSYFFKRALFEWVVVRKFAAQLFNSPRRAGCAERPTIKEMFSDRLNPFDLISFVM